MREKHPRPLPPASLRLTALPDRTHTSHQRRRALLRAGGQLARSQALPSVRVCGPRARGPHVGAAAPEAPGVRAYEVALQVFRATKATCQETQADNAPLLPECAASGVPGFPLRPPLPREAEAENSSHGPLAAGG